MKRSIVVVIALVTLTLITRMAFGQTCKTLGPQTALANYYTDIGDADQTAIIAVRAAGLMADCDAGMFCPNKLVTRAELAFIVTSLKEYPAAAKYIDRPSAAVYSDIPLEHPFACWINAAKDMKAFDPGADSQNCFSDPNHPSWKFFCPNQAITRGEMATALARVKHKNEPTFTPSCTGNVFSDVTCGTPGDVASWIKDATSRCLTMGISNNQFRPLEPVSRADLAVAVQQMFLNCVDPSKVTLTVGFSGLGSGTVTSNVIDGVSINCASSNPSCSGSFTLNSAVILTAAGTNGSSFAKWTFGGSEYTNNPISVTMDQTKSVIATFTAPKYIVTVSKSGSATGRVFSLESGIDCGSVCSAQFERGKFVTLRAEYSPDVVFEGWSGGVCEGYGDCTFTITANTAITAQFRQANGKYQVTGRVLLGGQGLSGVQVDAQINEVSTNRGTTDANGYYVITTLEPSNYVFIPSRVGYTFTPSAVGKTISNKNETIDFTATLSAMPAVPYEVRAFSTGEPECKVGLYWSYNSAVGTHFGVYVSNPSNGEYVLTAIKDIDPQQVQQNPDHQAYSIIQSTSGLQDYQNYYFRVVAVNDAVSPAQISQHSRDSNPIQRCQNVIEAPTNLNASSVVWDEVSLSWTNNSTIVPIFIIEKTNLDTNTPVKVPPLKYLDANGVPAGEFPIGRVEYVDKNVAPNTRYRYRVRGEGALSGGSLYTEFSDPAYVTTRTPSMPPPFNLVRSAISNNPSSPSVTLSWEFSPGNSQAILAGFMVERSDDVNGNFVKIGDVQNPQQHYYVDSNVSLCKVYFYRVLAFTTSGVWDHSLPSSEIEVTMAIPPPSCWAETYSLYSINVMWSPAERCIPYGYELQTRIKVQEVMGDWVTIPTPDIIPHQPDVEHYQSFGHSPGHVCGVYYYRIRATNGHRTNGVLDMSDWSYAPGYQLHGDPPPKPTHVVASDIGPHSVTLHWEGVDNCEFGFSIQAKGGGTFHSLGYVDSTVTSYVVTHLPFSHLQPSTTYTFRIGAHGNSGSGGNPDVVVYSDEISVTTRDDSQAPTWPAEPELRVVKILQRGSDRVKIEWPTASDDVAVTKYKIERQGAAPVELPGDTTSAWVSGLLVDTSYTFIVKAGDARNNWSDPLAVTGSTLGKTLVGHWAFDEGSGSASADSSGYGNTSSLVNNPAWVSGKIGSALSFNGSSQYVRINDIPIDTTPGAKNSVAFWMFWTGGDVQIPFAWASNYDLYLCGGTFGFNTGESNNIGIPSNRMANRWVHVVAIFPNGIPSPQTAELYIDGAKQNIVATGSPTTASRSAVSSVQISGWSDGPDFLFGGKIDDLRIYNFAIDVAKVRELCNIPPPPPTQLQGHAHSTSEIHLTWVDNSYNETNFVVLRKIAGGTWDPQLVTTDANITTYTYTGLLPETEYVFKVWARNEIGNSEQPTNELTISTPIAPPSEVVAEAKSPTSIEIRWRDNSTKETGYSITRRCLDAGCENATATYNVVANVTSYLDNNGVWPVTNYQYTVCLLGNGSGYCAVANVTTPNGPPLAPSGLEVTSGHSVDLRWTDNANNESGFKVERKPSGETDWQLVAEMGASIASEGFNRFYQDTHLKPGTTYLYRVKATNVLGDSPYSNEAIATTNVTPPQATPAIELVNLSGVVYIRLGYSGAGIRVNIWRRDVAENAQWSQLAHGALYQNMWDYQEPPEEQGSYYYRAWVLDTGGNSLSQWIGFDNSTKQLFAAPAPPSNLSGEARSANSIYLHWTDNSTTEPGYAVERKLSSTQTWETVTLLDSSVTGWLDTELSPGTSYDYRICTYAPAGEVCSSATTLSTLNSRPPSPTNLQGHVHSTSEIHLTWVDNSNNETSFVVERKVAGGIWDTLQVTTAANTTTYTYTGLLPETVYSFRVWAKNQIGNSEQPTYEVTISTKLLAPTNLQAVMIAPNRVQVTWTNNSQVATEVRIGLAYNGPGSPPGIQLPASTTSYVFDDVANCMYDMYYSVRAKNANTNTLSDFYSVQVNNGVIPAPSNVQVIAVTATEVVLSWQDNTYCEQMYVIERSPSGQEGTFAELGQVGIDATSFTDSTLEACTMYYYRVKADNGRLSATSAVVAGRGVGDSNPPSTSNAFGQTATSIFISWNPGGFCTDRYLVERGPGTSGPWTVRASLPTNTTQYEDLGLSNVTQYCYRVRAENGSAYSPIACATPAPLLAPSQLGPVSRTSSTLEVSWVNNTPVGYRKIVEQQTGGGAWSQACSVAARTEINGVTYYPRGCTFTLSGSNATQYVFRAKLINDAQGTLSSDYSNTFKYSKGSTIPAAPTNVAATAVSSTQIDLTWSSGSAEHRIERATSAKGPWQEVGVVSAGVYSYLSTGLQPNTKYYFVVRRMGTTSDSPYSSVVNRTTLAN